MTAVLADTEEGFVPTFPSAVHDALGALDRVLHPLDRAPADVFRAAARLSDALHLEMDRDPEPAAEQPAPLLLVSYRWTAPGPYREGWALAQLNRPMPATIDDVREIIQTIAAFPDLPVGANVVPLVFTPLSAR